MADKIFFSYSRFDSAFTLRLASDLRNAGAIVWLDQLDIAPGNRWDSEIEKALTESDCVLAVISPKSLASDNAMDEISYALEEKKKVIPILLTNTETPFRLRRLQRVDFTCDYDTGFRQLLHALHLEKTKAASPVKEPILQGNNDSYHADEDDELWAACCATNTVAAYQQYLRTTLSKQHLDEAWRRLDVLQEKPLSRAIKLPQTSKETGSIRRKKNMLLATLLIPLAAIAFGALKMINKEPEKTATQSTAHVPEPEKDPLVGKSADTATLQTIQPSANHKDISAKEEPASPIIDKKVTVQKKSEQNTFAPASKKEDSQPDVKEQALPTSPVETTTKAPVTAKKSLVINSKVIVNLLLLDNPDMHERKKSDQPVRFSVMNDVVYDGEIIIRKDAIAKGTLTIGRIQTDIVIDKVDGANGNIIYLKSEKNHGRRNDVETKRNYTAIVKPGTHIEL